MKLADNKSYDISKALNARLKGQYHSAICYEGSFSERTLIRAKQGEPVRAKSVKAIAKALDCEPEDLLNQNDVCWLSTRNASLTNPAAINIHASLSEFIDGVIAAAGILSYKLDQSDLEISIDFKATSLSLELCQLESGIKNYWSVKAGYPDDTGITYIESNDSAELQLELAVERLRMSVTDNVTINGIKQFSYCHKPGWLVVFHKFKPNDFESYVGEQHFLNAEDFQATLNEWLQGNNITDVNGEEGGVAISVDKKELGWNVALFNRANFGPGGGVVEAAVPPNFAKKLTTEIRSKDKSISCISNPECGSKLKFGPCKQSVSTY
ncbi:helix-turn-helix domain-containing protein [Idiomarina loihiensis]|uniref:Uncharacterized protein n=1 Tax=Idiomarina loihiensis (strain ATCC BAA-735 / DSM 15497 / L2-TR) TaxID=283942 RepID=Q5QX30_IDILO|nr:helix-turn-helix transcriptional regulator [Idiomarina loihiensis]AAV81482.1 Hypothetical protein IL0641 [Idiomarina loihiensis L2TR]AGM35509.1 hypothetical protein K734_03210 [Idiomarina loihiensis GSL 199]